MKKMVFARYASPYSEMQDIICDGKIIADNNEFALVETETPEQYRGKVVVCFVNKPPQIAEAIRSCLGIGEYLRHMRQWKLLHAYKRYMRTTVEKTIPAE